MKNLLNRTLALVCAILMMISLFALPAFAEEDDHAGHDHATETTSATEETTPTAEVTTPVADTTDTAKEGLSTAAIVWIVIGGVLVVAGVVLGIKYREKIVKALRVYKSEFKKVSWLSPKETLKSSWVVIVVLAVCALVICLLDLGLSKGLLAMVTALRDLFPKVK